MAGAPGVQLPSPWLEYGAHGGWEVRGLVTLT